MIHKCRDALMHGPDDPLKLLAMFAAIPLGATCWAVLLWAAFG